MFLKRVIYDSDVSAPWKQTKKRKLVCLTGFLAISWLILCFQGELLCQQLECGDFYYCGKTYLLGGGCFPYPESPCRVTDCHPSVCEDMVLDDGRVFGVCNKLDNKSRACEALKCYSDQSCQKQKDFGGRVTAQCVPTKYTISPNFCGTKFCEAGTKCFNFLLQGKQYYRTACIPPNGPRSSCTDRICPKNTECHLLVDYTGNCIVNCEPLAYPPITICERKNCSRETRCEITIEYDGRSSAECIESRFGNFG
jgi:hypothetical protein